MSVNRDFWNGVATFVGAPAPRCEWEHACGKHFAALSKRFLIGSGNPAQYADCPLKCGCVHRRGPMAGNRVRYICDCDDQTCPEFTLSSHQSESLSLDGTAFCATLAECLGVVRGKNSLGKHRRAIELGHLTVNETPWPVWICFPSVDDKLINNVRAIIESTTQRPLAVLTPEHEAEAGELLARNGSRLLALRSHVTLGKSGELFADEKILDRIVREGAGGMALRPKGAQLSLRGKRYELVDGFTGLVDLKTKKTMEIKPLRCQAALRALVQGGAGSQAASMHKKDLCDIVYKDAPGNKPRSKEDKPIQFFRHRRDGKTIQMPIYNAIVRSDEHGKYWLEL